MHKLLFHTFEQSFLYFILNDPDKNIMTSILNDDDEEYQRLHSLIPDFGPSPSIDIEKTFELIPNKDKHFLLMNLKKLSLEK